MSSSSSTAGQLKTCGHQGCQKHLNAQNASGYCQVHRNRNVARIGPKKAAEALVALGQVPDAGDMIFVGNETEGSDSSQISLDNFPGRKHLYVFQGVPTEWAPCNSWMVGTTDIMKDLQAFRDVSIELNNSGNIKDDRILALYDIFPFSVEIDRSVTRYMGRTIHDGVMEQLKSTIQGNVTRQSDKISIWSAKIANYFPTWRCVTEACVTITNEAKESDNDNDLIAAMAMQQLATRLANDQNEKICEDTFVHRYLDSILDSIFSATPLLRSEWANLWLQTSKGGEAGKVLKPDYVVYVAPHNARFDVLACEVKAPGNTSPPPLSDYVKLAMEMKHMLLILQELVDAPFVLGILVTGADVRTYRMDPLGSSAFRLVQLAKAPLIVELTKFASFSTLFASILQIRNLAHDMGLKIEAQQLAMVKTGKRKSLSSIMNSRDWKKVKMSPP